MHLTRLSLLDFRSYEAADVALGPGTTVLVGLNGQGKTNFAEAIVYLASQTSHRVAKDTPLIRSGAPRALVSARVRWQEREQSIELEINDGRANRARVAGAPRRPREALGVVRAVIFAPEDLALVKGDPAVRRRFLDELVVALAPRMAGVIADYERVVRQRSALLKSVAGTWRRDDSYRHSLELWNEQLAQHGARLVGARLAAVRALATPVGDAYEHLAPHTGDLRVTYAASWWPELSRAREVAESELAAALAAAMADRERAELERGITLVGPHRDDLLLDLGGLPAKGYASHGESWSIALALRLGTFTLLRESFDTGGDPVLILDDVFAELDSGRRERLARLVADAEQVLVTAAVPDDVPAALVGNRFVVQRIAPAADGQGPRAEPGPDRSATISIITAADEAGADEAAHRPVAAEGPAAGGAKAPEVRLTSPGAEPALAPEPSAGPPLAHG